MNIVQDFRVVSKDRYINKFTDEFLCYELLAYDGGIYSVPFNYFELTL